MSDWTVLPDEEESNREENSFCRRKTKFISDERSRADDEESRKGISDCARAMSWFLRPIGIWPCNEKAGVLEKFFVESQICLCYFFICFLLVPCALHTFLDEENPAMRLKMIGPLSFCLMAITKYCFLVLRRADILWCLEHIASDWTTEKSATERAIMLKAAKFGRSVAGLCAGFMYGGGFFYHTVMPISCGVIVTPDNISHRPLTYPVYDAFFDAQASPTYEIVFAVQWLSGFVLYTITIGACSIAAVFAMHACGQFGILVGRLRKLVDGDGRLDTVDDRMANIVELHLRTLSLVRRVEGILNEVCLIEFIGCTANICFLGYYFITEWEQSETISTVTYCVLFVSFTFNIFIFCYIGEMLTEQSKRVGMVTYTIDWYRLRGTKARELILILLVAKNPSSITAGKMAELSLSSFCNVLKTALTYLNLLRTVAS